MSKLLNSLYFQVLVLSMVVGALLGCGGWFAHKNAQDNNQKEQEKDFATPLNNKTAVMPLDSIILRTETDMSGGASGYIRYYFDTTKLKYFPDLNAQTIYTKPEYKALFGWGDDYTVKSTWLYYKGIHYYRFTCSAHERNGKLITANGIKFIPLADPSDVKISPEQAIEIMLAQDYPTRKQEFRARYLDSLGYIPPPMDSILREYPYDFTKDYLPNAKFPWETKNSDKVDVTKHYAYPKPKLIYLASATPESPLVYRAELQTLRNSWEVYVDAVTGEVLFKYRQDDHFTCDPIAPDNYTADYLYYYNSISPTPVIPVSVCNFGSCTEYRLATDNLQVFCQNGNFSGWVANPRQSFIDWTVSGSNIENRHYSPAINMSNITLPNTIGNTNGSATFGVVSGWGSATFTYSGTQILTSNGLVSSSIPTTTSGLVANNLTAGIYELTLTDDNGCAFTEYAALGMQGGPAVTGNVTEAADCYNNAGNIHLSVANVTGFGGQLPQIWIKGPFNTAGFVAPTSFEITDNNYEFDLKQFNYPISGTENHYPLPPGNYAILALNPYNNTVGGFNIRLNYPAGGCETERRILETAYWAIDRTQNIFKGDNSAINGGTGINLQLPSGIAIRYGAAIYTDGYCQLAHSPHPICVGLVNDAIYNAKFIPNTIVGPEMADNGKTLFKVTRGVSATYPTVSLDVMAHEYGHAINRYGVSIFSSATDSEAEAINEGFSDIVACIAESTCKPAGDPNIWIMGDAFPTSFPKRNIANPHTNHFPTIYEGQYWNPTSADETTYGLQYIRSGVFTYWFYLLATGGSQTVNGVTYTVEAIGMENAAKIILSAFVDENFDLSTPANQNYHGLCTATLKAANALFPADAGSGNCSLQLKQVYNAWKAVGVNCPLPAGVICSLCTEDELNITLQTDCYTNYVTNNFFLCGTPPFNIEGTYYYPSGGFISDILGNTDNYFFAHTIQNNATYTYQDLPVMYEITDAKGNIQTINSLNCCEVRTSSVTSACAFNESNGSYIVNINIAYQYYVPFASYTITVSYENATGQQFTQTFVDSDGNQNSQISVPDAAANTPITFTITDWRGCSLSGSIPQINNTDCETIIEGIVVGSGSYNSPPAFTQMPPAMLSVCAGQQICLPYHATDINGDNANVALSGLPSGIPVTQTINQSGSTNIGEICFTPPSSWVNTVMQLHLLAFDYQNITYAPLTLSILCCPTGFNHPQELTALYDCNGNLYQPAEATVTALTNNCSINFTVNGSSNHTLTGLGAGVYDLTLEFNNEIIQIPDAITVTGIYLDDADLQVTHTAQPSLAACNTDQCTGQITLSVTGGTGNYTYLWSDCQSCNSPVRNHLCAGSYTVTVTDDETGCQTVYTANVGQTYPATAGTLSDNEFSVAPTVFSGSTTLTYRVAYNAQVSIAMYNSQGNLVAQPLANELKAEGEYSLTHTPPAGLPQGIYFYILYVCGEPLTRVAVKVY